MGIYLVSVDSLPRSKAIWCFLCSLTSTATFGGSSPQTHDNQDECFDYLVVDGRIKEIQSS